MSYGLRINNDVGFVQIDGVNIPYNVVTQGTITVGPMLRRNRNDPGGDFGNEVYGGALLTFPVQEVPPLVFVRPPFGVTVGIWTDVKVGSVRLYTFGGTHSVEYYVMRRTPTIVQPGAEYGLAVYTMDGELAYSSEDQIVTISSVGTYVTGHNAPLVTIETNPLRKTFLLLNSCALTAYERVVDGFLYTGTPHFRYGVVNSNLSVSFGTTQYKFGNNSVIIGNQFWLDDEYGYWAPWDNANPYKTYTFGSHTRQTLVGDFP